MINLLFGLILWLQPELILGPGALSYADLDSVVARKKWLGTQAFDVLVAPPNCNLLARQGWLITESGVYSMVVVDCAPDKYKPLWDKRGLLVDTNRVDLVGEKAWMVIR